VTIEFPKLAKKYGERATYADDPKAHIRTEFGFDMVQVAKNRYTSDRYHHFIGFEVSRELLDRAFLKTYGLQLKDVFGDTDLAIGTYRRAISLVIPEMTRVALLARKQEIVKDTPNFPREGVSLLPVAQKLRETVGEGVPKAGTRHARACVLSPADSESRAVQRALVQDSHAADGGYVHQERGSHGRGLRQAAARDEGARVAAAE
jgi:hypothetical protein